MILKSNGKEIATDVDFACSMLSQAKGLMFSRRIPENYALVFVMKRTQKVSLHMLFVTYPIDVIFLDEQKRVIRTDSMKAWIGNSSSRKKIKYIIETSHGKNRKMNIREGDLIEFEDGCQ